MQRLKLFRKQSDTRGVAGIEVLIEIVVGLFILGVLVFSITLMGSEISTQDSLFVHQNRNLINSTSTLPINDTGTTYPSGLIRTPEDLKDCSLTIIDATAVNDTATFMTVSGNLTVTGCRIAFSSASAEDASRYNQTTLNITGSYTYNEPGDSIDTINDTYQAIGEVTDWFPIIIIFGAIVVLILLTVLIIRSIRSTGMGGAGSGAGGLGRESA